MTLQYPIKLMKFDNKYWNFKHPKQIHSVKWLVEKFWPVKGWTQEDLDNLKKIK